jgi:hypothetical protein
MVETTAAPTPGSYGEQLRQRARSVVGTWLDEPGASYNRLEELIAEALDDVLGESRFRMGKMRERMTEVEDDRGRRG